MLLDLASLTADAIVSRFADGLMYNDCKLGNEGYRSEQLLGPAEAVFPVSCHTPYSRDMEKRFDSFALCLQRLVQREASCTSNIQLLLQEPMRLVVTNWQHSLFDGLLCVQTNGFFDECGMPPWDTWLALIRLTVPTQCYALLSWIPDNMRSQIDNAINIDASESVSWLKYDEISLKYSVAGWGARWPS